MVLYNAPAGSGKTTTIQKMVKNIVITNPKSRVLCITYTNRATEELINKIESKNVDISTIHSFLAGFINIYFSHEEIIDLYIEVFEQRINDRINNQERKEDITESNQKYIDEFGELTIKKIKENISSLRYREQKFSSVYYGSLGHDDLLFFTKMIIERYPVIAKRINSKYDYIFIDEYQDTFTEVLDIFYNAVKNTSTKLFLFGDKMQQIYKNYDGKFEQQLETFDITNRLKYNYRSSQQIIDVLNAIYNNSDFNQEIGNIEENINSDKPLVIITDKIEREIRNRESKYEKVLKLYIANRKRFKVIGAMNLYSSINNMEEYSFGKKYSVVDVLTTDYKDNPDDLMKLILTIYRLKKYSDNKKYGIIIQTIKSLSKSKKNSLFNSDLFKVLYNSDKQKLSISLSRSFKFIDDESSKTILECINYFIEQGILVDKNVKHIIENDLYKDLLNVEIVQFTNLANYLSNPNVSTQHGVKGEGHDNVFFIADDSSNPSVKIYDFFKLWSKFDINITDLERFYYSFNRDVENVNQSLNQSYKDITAAYFNDNHEMLENLMRNIANKYKDNLYFKNIYGDLFNDFFERKRKKQGKGKFVYALNINKVYGIFSAYKLFYVGCSRAKKNLVIFIDKNKIFNFESELIGKFKKSYFQVNCKDITKLNDEDPV